VEAERQALKAQAKIREKLRKRRKRHAQAQRDREEGIIKLHGRSPKNKTKNNTIPPDDSR
jgi:hypothetical protein